MATRGDLTRERILDVAEQLFGADGVANVSLSQIRVAAGQKNERAVQYHFTDRSGLVQAIADRHQPRVQAIEARITAEHARRRSTRSLLEIWGRPIAEYGTLGPSERAWVKILADIISNPRLSPNGLYASQPAESLAAGVAVYERLCRDFSPQLALDRSLAVAQFVLFLCADRARLVDAPKVHRSLSSDDAFIGNLMDMAYAALVARPSQARRH